MALEGWDENYAIFLQPKSIGRMSFLFSIWILMSLWELTEHSPNVSIVFDNFIRGQDPTAYSLIIKGSFFPLKLKRAVYS